MPTPIFCSIEDCDRKSEARGLCHTHYEYWRRTGITADPSGRVCAHCGVPLRAEMRIGTRFCSRACRERQPSNVLAKRAWHHRNLYGMSVEQFDATLAAQSGRCACCGDSEPGGKHPWHIDHDHETGAIRGILCSGCNVGLGHFRDDPERLIAAIAYLQRTRR